VQDSSPFTGAVQETWCLGVCERSTRNKAQLGSRRNSWRSKYNLSSHTSLKRENLVHMSKLNLKERRITKTTGTVIERSHQNCYS